MYVCTSNSAYTDQGGPGKTIEGLVKAGKVVQAFLYIFFGWFCMFFFHKNVIFRVLSACCVLPPPLTSGTVLCTAASVYICHCLATSCR